ncbi:hypothetical protein CDD82_1977 [Ophiocordyceps australis]|uniref:Zn(2)-C6 fungal-type domain-containing protein n=1 Tax=Ophiocordyceps australis TaxID=1399860 RepID=A0A2C5XWN9_9HYPO|nr:hypothetical protein CDD82_1977 [Ophiocordyceps australis]
MYASVDDKLHSPSVASTTARHQPEPESESHSDDDHDDSVSRNGKRKRHVSVSCEICKQRKVRCDRGQPACGWCARNGVACEYKERKRPGLRAGFGKELQQRMDKLEGTVNEHSEMLSQANLASILRALNRTTPARESQTVCRPLEPETTPGKTSPLHTRKRSSFASLSNLGDFSLPPPAAHDNLKSPTYATDIPPALQLPPIRASAAEASQRSAPSSVVDRSQPATSPLPPERDLPPHDLLRSLVDVYFKHVNSWCPILHRASTLDSLWGSYPLQEENRILLHAIVATAMRFSTDSRLTEERKQHYYQCSKEKVWLYGLDHSSVRALQALVILALDLCGSSNGPPGWNIMALITRSVVQLGLAVESSSSSVAPKYASIYTLRAMALAEAKDFVEDESRRRLFWMVYLLDRYATIATAFDFALPDKEIDRTLPCRDDLWAHNIKSETRWFQSHQGDIARRPDKPENLGAFSYYIEILGILSQIHTFLKQPVDISILQDVAKWQQRFRELDQRLTQWKGALPEEIGDLDKALQPGSGKSISPTWVMLHATLYTTVVRLHSSAAYPTTRSHFFTSSRGAAKRCVEAVEKVTKLAEFVVDAGLLSRLGPPFAFTIWVCARLLLVHGSSVKEDVAPRVLFLLDTLRKMGKYWPVAARYCGLLQRVLDEKTDHEQQGGSTPNSMRILSDMRRTAFDLDFLMSRQSRNGMPHVEGLSGVTATKEPAPNDFEWLDVFDFFNFPRAAWGGESGEAGQEDGAANGRGWSVMFNGGNLDGGEAASDWLFVTDDEVKGLGHE